jgi:endonuclease-3
MGTKKVKITVDVTAAKARVAKIFPILKKAYPDARVALDHENPLQLLVATIMAAQCTDARVNIVTKDMFKKYKVAADYANVELSELENDIRSTGFFRNKSKNIKAAGALLVEKFGGVVPRTMDELLEIPGVGRKTANVMLGNCFDTPGVVCDTHVIRLSRRLGLSEHKDPTKLEFDLMEIVPKKRGGGWSMFSHLIVFHGRNTCKARKPDCENCPIAEFCPSANDPSLW